MTSKGTPPVTPLSEAQATLPGMALRHLFRTLFFRGRAGRRPRARSTPKSMQAVLWLSLIFYTIMGCAAFAFPRSSVLAFAAPLHGVTFFLLGIYVAASAGEVLFNQDEADILLHRPVLPQTVLWAKVRVLVEITYWLGGAFNLVGLGIGWLAVPDAGWRFLFSHTFAVALEALFCVGGVVLTYELCLRWFGRARLDSLMTAAQITLSVGGIVIWQLMPRTMVQDGTVPFDLRAWWTYLLPPFWFAALDETLTGHGNPTAWILAATAWVATGGVLALAFGKLAVSYGHGLQALHENVSPARSVSGGRRWLDRCVHAPPLRWWLRDSRARASFLLTAAYLLRDREIKLRVYPQLASVFALSVALNMRDTGGSTVGPCCCLLSMAPINALESLRYSQQWQAADIFRCAPMSGPGPLCDGARKAVLVCLFFPMMLVLGAVACVTVRDPSDLLVAAACLMVVPLYARIPTWGGRGVPLSEPNEEMQPRRGLVYVGIFAFSAALMSAATVAKAAGYLIWFLSVECLVVTSVYMVQRRRLAAVTWRALDEA